MAPERIISVENEFGMHANPMFGKSSLYEALPPGIFAIGEFLSNGSRLYIDINETLEYAAPESLGPVEATYTEFAGRQLVLYALSALVRQGRLDRFTLRRRNLAADNQSWGNHENYCTTRETFNNDDLAHLVISHSATRPIISGSGLLKPSQRNPIRVVPSQKAKGINEVIGSRTTSHKNIFNTRDEPHAGGNWARIHVINGDGNLSPWSTWMKLGCMSLVIRLVENGFHQLDAVMLNDPLGAFKSVGDDAYFTQRFRTQLGAKVSALDIQERLIERCEVMREKMEIPDSESAVLDEWRRSVDDLRIDPARLIFRVDWITRAYYLRRAVEKHGLTGEEDISHLDQSWEIEAAMNRTKDEPDKEPRMGIGVTKFVPKMTFPGFDPKKIDTYVLNAPVHTRAHRRAEAMRKYKRRSGTKVNWGKIFFDNHPSLVMDNPYNSE